MSPESLGRALEDFLAEARSACVLEAGELLFDLSSARYSITADRGKCVLHLWSTERNTVRRVLAAERKKDALVLSVQRFGQSKPSRLEILRDPDRRTPSTRRTERIAYNSRLQGILKRSFPGWSVTRLSNAVDLEHSFGPIYARGMVQRGRSAFAVLGGNAHENQASIDAALTFAVLWLDLCRRSNSRLVVEGIKLFVPAGCSEVVRARMAHLDHSAAKFQLYELEESEQALEEIDCRDAGNIATRLVACVDQQAVRDRFTESIATVFGLLDGRSASATELKANSSAELSFRLQGLEFAKARLANSSDQEIVFGAGSNETALTQETREIFQQLTARLFDSRKAENRNHTDALWRMQPERWLESLVVSNVTALDARLTGAAVYSQVPAFAASDRAMIDVLTATRDGRLAVLELKANEDIHLPLQGLDYWARVQWHHKRGEFQRYGYFTGRPLSQQPPLLFLVAPALHVHPATDTLLRYMAPEIDCTLLGLHENWRHDQRVIFRKHRHQTASAAM